MKKFRLNQKNRYVQLNKIERLKENKVALEAYEKIQEYSKRGYNSIPQDEKNFFLKCFGIFDKPATPNEFMLRVRVPGGVLDFEQASVLGEIGFEGCKAKIDGVSEYGVHIYLGGNTIGESRMGESILKSIPLRYAHKFIEELVGEYKRLKYKNESFEEFYERVLRKISKYSIGFILRFKAFLKEMSYNSKIGFDSIKQSGKIERYEVFELGEQIYLSLFGELPYSGVIDFEPIIKNQLTFEKGIDENIIELLKKMLDPNKKTRAKVFSELEELIKIYN
ncbi:MAG: hypothetical protein QM482_01015 [Sulfurospirillum sp.]